jgi:hypothetical protein
VRPSAGLAINQWGTFISGYAPIRNASGKAVAVLGIDMFTRELDKISAQSFTPVYFFIGFFLVFLVIRYAALNKPLMSECAQEICKKKRKVCLWIVFLSLLIFGIIYALRFYRYQLLVHETGTRLMAIAVTAADDFDPADLEQLHFARDMKTEAYQRVFKRLNEIRNKVPEVTFAYIVRPTNNPTLFEFVADSDSNYNLALYSKYTLDDPTPFSESDENVWPGVIYDASSSEVFASAKEKPAYASPFVDQWGTLVTGCAPIFGMGKTLGILCLDVARS